MTAKEAAKHTQAWENSPERLNKILTNIELRAKEGKYTLNYGGFFNEKIISKLIELEYEIKTYKIEQSNYLQIKWLQ